jgi:hypothetical protein
MDKFSLFLPLLFLAIWIKAAAIPDEFEFSQEEIDALKNKYPRFSEAYLDIEAIDGYSSPHTKLTRLYRMINSLCLSENGKPVGIEYKRVLVQKFSQIASSVEPWELLDYHLPFFVHGGTIFLLISMFNKDYDTIIHRVMSLGGEEDIKSTVLPYLAKALDSGDEKLVEVARKWLFLRLYEWSSDILRQEIEKISKECKICSDLYERSLKADSLISLFDCYVAVNNLTSPSRYFSLKVYIIHKYRQINSTAIPFSILESVEKTRDLKPLIFHYMVTVANPSDYYRNLVEIVNTLDFQPYQLKGAKEFLNKIINMKFGELMNNLVSMINIEIQQKRLIKQ